VAKTIAGGFTSPHLVTQTMILSVLAGASIWNIVTWYFGIPSSSSHALIGALAGAVVLHAGVDAFRWRNLVSKVLVPLVLSPVMGFVVAICVMTAATWAVRRSRPRVVIRVARRMQILSACTMAFAHGCNDAQKVMGIITLSLVSYVTSGARPLLPQALAPAKGGQFFDVPRWVMFACATAIAAGTASGGKRIIKTMGSKIVKIGPLQGVVSDTAGTATILTASALGVPVSTTHCVNACIMGVGASKRVNSVRWGVARRIVAAWVITLPAAAFFAAIAFWALSGLGMTL